jgi:GT2 family glycosyltransferase/SAM-dependent methyltransferase
MSPGSPSNEVDLSVRNNSWTQQVVLIGENKDVLEIGCGEGIVASALKKRRCRVFCVEKDPNLAVKASEFAEEIIVGDIESLDISQLFRGRLFDVVLLGDVLEHMRDPLGVLSSVAKKLKHDGYLIGSIPNIAHASVRLQLLSGHFNYQDEGLLDRGHLRFFTRLTVQSLFASAGLGIEKCIRVWADLPKEGMIGIDESSLLSIILDSLRKDPDAMTYQFVVKARPGKTTYIEEWADGKPVSPNKFRVGELDVKLKGIKEIESSPVWMLVRRYRGLLNRWFPYGSRRRQIVDKLVEALDIALNEGLSGLFRRAINRCFKKQFFQLSLDRQYQVWLSNNQLTEKKLLGMEREVLQFGYEPKISIIMPVYNTNGKWLRLAIDSVIDQIYPNWELCIVDDASTKKDVRRILEEYSARDSRVKVKYLRENRGIAGASNEALAMASGEFVGFLDHDDELTRDALFEVVKTLNEDPNLDFIYSDEDKKDPAGRRVEAYFKPDWSPDLLLSMNYIRHLSVARKNLVDRLRGFRLGFEGSQDYDLILRISESTNRIAHIPRPLYSSRKVPGSAAASKKAKPYGQEAAKKALREALNRRGLKGEVLDGFGGRFRVKYAIHGAPLVSIIIPTKDKANLLKRCIDSIESRTSYKNYEIIIVDNNSSDLDCLAYLRSLHHRVLRFDEPFNFSRINNFGVKNAKGEHLVLLNNDTEVADEGWLEAMLEHSQRPEVGMVGGLLLYPSGSTSHTSRTIQHAGVVLGLGVAGHAFKYLPADRPKYFRVYRMIRNCSAVTAACAMIRRSVFEEVGGFDENLRVAFGDVDLCLRVREKGYLVVYTPYSMLYHHESASRGKLHPMDDEIYLINRWKDTLIRGDPYYNPNLTLLKEDYSLALQGSNIRPLAILLDIYHLRPDLQRTYPEARRGDYRRLIDWAAIRGITADRARGPLLPYASYYASNTSDLVRPLATLIGLYNSRRDLQIS